ncbi:MAG: 16S rRNA (uracil(1498)-N(3))-methyltransferase [Wujia sp.]
MPRFYVSDCSAASEQILITGEDVNHIKNVLRLKIGDEITVCDGAGKEYICRISSYAIEGVYAKICDIQANAAELPCHITLFQGMPKSDKLEFVIQKAVELGVHDIVPVMTARTVVKLEDKKKEKKLLRYNAIAQSAAKQSGRGRIPCVLPFQSWKEAMQFASDYDYILLPYESADGIAYAQDCIRQAARLPEGSKIGIFIGPEGGFAEEEVRCAKEIGAKVITLGNRILRTETAGLTTLSILMFEMECYLKTAQDRG